MLPEPLFFKFLENTAAAIEEVGKAIEAAKAAGNEATEEQKGQLCLLLGMLFGATLARGEKDDLMGLMSMMRSMRMEALAQKMAGGV